MKDSLASVLVNGGVAVIPTDTIYGVVGQASNKKTVERIYRIKGRKPEKPFIVLISGLKDLEIFDIRPTKKQIEVFGRLWPGPYSIILPCERKDFDYLHRRTGTLAFRWPKNDDLVLLLKRTGPLVAPSANPEGLEPAANIAEAKKYFASTVDTYKDGGELISAPSTLIDWTDKEPIVLRGDTSILKLLS